MLALPQHLGFPIVMGNTGSIGLPYETEVPRTNVRNPTWAEYAIIHLENEKIDISLRRVRYSSPDRSRPPKRNACRRVVD